MARDKIGIEFQTIGREKVVAATGDLAKGIGRINLAQAKLVKTQTTLAGTTKQYLLPGQKMATTFQKAGQETQKFTKITKDATLAQKGMLGQTQGLLSAVGKVATWTIATGAVFGLMRAMQGLVTTLMEFDDAMARVRTVTRGGAEALNQVREAVLDYGFSTSAALTDVAKAAYYLGSAGLTAEEQMVGLEHVMNLTVGTMGDVNEIARLVAGAYNVFGDSMEDAITASEKMQRISDILAFTYSQQQVELSEIASAMSLVGSTAALINMPFEVLVGTLGELNTGMLKGTRAGTCYDEKTEVLTKDGFKFWKDVTMDDVFATLNPKTHELEYQKPNKIIKEHYEGKMYRAVNKHLDLCVTPNHWMYTRPGDVYEKHSYESKQAKDIFGKRRTYLRGMKWNGEEPKYFILPSIVSNHGKNKEHTRLNPIKIPIEIFVEFMGYFLSEGSLGNYKDKRGCFQYRILIAQNRTEKGKWDVIEKCLNKMPFEYNYHFCQFSMHSQQLYSYLEQFGKATVKFVPSFIKNLSPRLLRIFLEAYKLGDGDKNGRIVTASIKMRDDLEEIALKAGYGVQHHILRKKGEISRETWSKKTKKNVFCPTSDIWQINICKTVEFSFNQKRNVKLAKKLNYNSRTKEEWIDYKGMIYCCNVPNHIVFVRRRGKTVWSMNSLMNAFLQISKKADQLTTKLGVVFDPSKPLDFVDIMGKLNKKFGDTALSVSEFRQLMDVFGLRGGRAIALLLNRYKEWLITVEKGSEDFEGFAKKMEEEFEDTLPRQLKILGNEIRVAFVENFQDAAGGLKELVKGAVAGLEKVRAARKAIEEEERIRQETGFIEAPETWGEKIGTIFKRSLINTLAGLVPEAAGIFKSRAFERNIRAMTTIATGIKPFEGGALGVAKTPTEEELDTTVEVDFELGQLLKKEQQRYNIQLMRLRGYTDEEIAQRKISDFLTNISAAEGKNLEISDLIGKSYDEQLTILTKLGGAPAKNLEEFHKRWNNYMISIEKNTARIANNIQKSFERGMEGLLTGGNWQEALETVSAAVFKAQLSEAVDALAKSGVFKTLAGGVIKQPILEAFKEGGDYAADQMRDALKTGGTGGGPGGLGGPDGGGIAGVVGAGVVAAIGGVFKPTTTMGQGAIGKALDIFAKKEKPFAFADPRTGKQQTMIPGKMGAGNKPVGSKAPPGFFGGGGGMGQFAGLASTGISGAMTGYGMTGTMGGAIGGAIGSFAGMALAATPFAPLAPFMPMLGGFIGGLFDKKDDARIETQEKERTVKVTSKIDITNKLLEVANRNLVALRVTMEPYPMPESAYLAERWGGRGGGASFGNIIIHVGSEAQGSDVADAFAERFIVSGNRILQ